MGLKDTLLCSAFAVIMPIGQALFKWAAIYNEGLGGPLPLRVLRNFPLLGAFAWYGLTALLWFYILTRVPLSSAYVFALMGTGLVPLIAWLIFKEPVSWSLALGYGLMLAGLAVIMIQNRA